MKPARPVRVALDVGGVLSKQPAIWRALVKAWQASSEVEVWIVTDMSDPARVQGVLARNGFEFALERIVCADFSHWADACKDVALEAHGIDVFIDDLPAYLSGQTPVRLLQMPDVSRPYYHDDWDNGENSDFGRRRPHHRRDDPND